MPGRQRRILVVEDDPDIMRILSHMLTTAGYEVVRAYGGEDALRKVKSQKIDLVLTDLAMPKVSGVDVIAAVKSDPATASVPCLAVTAFVWDQIAQTAGQAGCDGFIGKPFTTQQLLCEVEKHLGSPSPSV
ncbi:MAG: hypothetical protein A3J75_05320 [Acidobacteria bacterium RBG_16_68_9]|nr:MAG: hypothetical protein A3J75_05320 [Acidobacteria bacterium RBG_16_68_9]